ncbi:MAG TPA: hypothetical protein VNS59_06590 [Lysobacter sp.]|nr:hypothetical protein [Lysobacter sp.]
MANQKRTLLRSGWITTVLTVAIGAGLAGTALVVPQPAQAVHDEPTPFQLDGNPTKSILGGNPAVSPLDDDWDNIFNLGSGPTYPSPRIAPTVGGGEAFAVDGANLAGGKESSAWSGSNKDIDEINDGIAGTDDWEYASSKVTPDKDNITNAYAKAYSIDHDGDGSDDAGDTPNHLVVFFGADRFANNGDAALGFWFFRNEVGLGSGGKFVGKHAVGDILVQVDFVSGGSSSEIQIFKWVGSGGDYGALEEIGFGHANGDTVCLADDTACATTNETATASPWAYTPKSGTANVFPTESMFEGGIDITALVGQVCFSAFMAETRSSHSETAELKDFALSDFDLCSVSVEKTCVKDSTYPIVDPAKETFTTKHTVVINNTGFGPLYDVELRDDSVDAPGTTPPNKVCSIASISGGVDNPDTTGGIDFDDNQDFIEVANRLDPGSMTVTLLCTTGDNPFRNGVTVQSKPTPSSSTSDVGDNDTETQAEADVCGLTLSPGLSIQKWCQGDAGTAGDLNPAYADRASKNQPNRSVVLNASNSFKPDVCVDIRLANTVSTQRMEILSFDDARFATLSNPTGSLLSSIPTDSKGRRTLAPMGTTGDSVVVSRCYTPSAPDGNQTDPGLAAYTNTVTAHGRGAITPTIFPTQDPDVPGIEKISDTATCKLCPTCPTCGTGGTGG